MRKWQKDREERLKEELKINASVARRMCSVVIKEGEVFKRPKWHKRGKT